MRDPQADPDNLRMQDFWCDFCHRPWSEDQPIIEGHHGSLICGRCLTLAYAETVHNAENAGRSSSACTMCLEHREEPAWQSPMFPEAVVCRRCVKLGAGTLKKDKDWSWTPPPPPGAAA